MVVALGAGNRQTEECFTDRVHAIDHSLDAKLLRLDPAFLVQHRIAQKAGSDPLLQRGIRQQVARELLNRESVERHVVVEGLDHPIAIGPD